MRYDIDRYHNFEYLLNAIRKLEIPRLEINADRLMIELNWTDVLQTLIDYANQNVLRSFPLHGMHCENSRHKQHLKAFLKKYPTASPDAEFTIIDVDPQT